MKSTDEQNDAYRRGIDGPQLKRGSTELRAALGNVDARLGDRRAWLLGLGRRAGQRAAACAGRLGGQPA